MAIPPPPAPCSQALKPLLDRDDIIVDGGNEHFAETVRREAALAASHGLHFVGMGISGGAEGARHGPSLMPGGSTHAYEALAPILNAMAAKAPGDGSSCVTHVGPNGAGHYVKMVHNGIEYADMQFIAECYDLLRNAAGMGNDDISATFDEWNGSDLESFLIEITAKVLRKRDDREGASENDHLVDKILDQAGSKGTGKWTVQLAADSGVAAPSVSAALEARFVSAALHIRGECAQMFGDVAPNPSAAAESVGAPSTATKRASFAKTVSEALYVAKIIAYAQGFSLLQTASEEHGWNLRMGELARIWRGGCIIRAKLLDLIIAAYARKPDLPNLVLDPAVAETIKSNVESLRAVVLRAVGAGIPVPALTSALQYFDAMRRARGPANIIQAQRDAFGAHTFKRTDVEGSFHAEW